MDEIVINLDGNKIVVKVRHSNRARRIGLRSKVEGVELIIPVNGCLNQGKEFLLKNLEWIREELSKKKVTPMNLSSIPILGKKYTIKHINTEDEIYVVRYEKSKVVEISCSRSQKEMLLVAFLKEVFLKEIKREATAIAKKHNLRYNEISITSATRKWGSCSSDKHLKLNWRLVFADIAIARSVVAHELSHTSVMNHREDFWHCLDLIDPENPVNHLWLKKEGHKLYSILSNHK